uniref:Granulins domain-containing protein n=1 Tax=Tetraodon nigroviridis TaxID=99883 RepID=H3BZ49_TETNG
MLHCCPSRYTCNLATQMCEKHSLPWFSIPMVMQEAERSSALVLPASVEDSRDPAEEEDSLVVHCDNHYMCPDGNTCCRSPTGVWSCCIYSPGNCCLDGRHCCPMGYHCDSTSRHCLQSLRYPFLARERPSVFQAALIAAPEERSMLLQEKPLTLLTEISNHVQEAVGVKCDSSFSCPEKMTCCKDPQGQWGCCPYQMVHCAADGLHCCEYGYTCSSSSLSCKKSFSP